MTVDPARVLEDSGAVGGRTWQRLQGLRNGTCVIQCDSVAKS